MLIVAGTFWASTLLAQAPPGDAVVRAPAGKSEIVVTTTARLAGAIHSLTWGGKEFIDSFDHGRQLQSASAFDAGAVRFWAEAYNPTEAGSRRDGAGPTSSSKLLSLTAKGNKLSTTTQMAYWLAPGEKSSGHPARNHRVLSDIRLTKDVTLGIPDHPQVIDYRVTFHMPAKEKQHYAQFEALTGYMPAEFSTFWTLDPATGKRTALSDGPGEQSLPVILATPTGSHAMGVYSPDQPSKGFEQAGYGRFRFVPEKVVKWNCVFRVQSRDGVPTGDHSFRMFVAVGTLDDVTRDLSAIARKKE